MAAAKKRTKGRFIGIPYHVAQSYQFATLSAHANKLLLDLLLQYTGSNNGRLSACWTLMRARQWRSTSTVFKAKKELLEKGFIVVTKSGKKMRGHPTLLAITWNGIDDCNGEIFDECIKVSVVPLSLWNKPRDIIDPLPKLKVIG
ncbi:MAG: hypothetical protein V7744_20835 [Pseudomonadales bacterium]